MDSNITIFQKFGLSTTGNFRYSSDVNAFLGNGYTSMAGNTYFNEMRFMDGILIKEDVGQGWAHTFLNGIRIFDIKNKVILCERSFNCTYYSQFRVKSEIKEMLTTLLHESARKEGIILNTYDVDNKLETMIERSFEVDQREMLASQSKLYLNQ